jgi:hypothetical protein
MKKLTELTPEQESRLPGWVERWVDIGLSTEPADWATAERGIAAEYRMAGLEPPSIVVRLGSPLAAAVGAALLGSSAVDVQVSAQVSDQVRAQVSDQVRDQVSDQVRDQVRAQVDVQVSDQVRAQVSDQVRDQVGAQVDVQVSDQVGALWTNYIGGALWANYIGGALWANYIGGALWASWPAYTSFFRSVCGIDISDARELTTGSCGWWYPLSGAVVISDRPDRLLRDRFGTLHAEHGPAMRWRDGWAIYSWHGVGVPGEWIERPGDVDPRLALTHDNAEQRRCLAEIIGWERVLQQISYRTIATDRDENGQPRELIEVQMPDGPARFVRVICGTGRRFVIGADNADATPQQAIARSYNKQPGEYRPEVRT